MLMLILINHLTQRAMFAVPAERADTCSVLALAVFLTPGVTGEEVAALAGPARLALALP